jgi:hypothetical protein
MRFPFLTLMLLAFPALADSEARYGNDSIRVTAKPCADAKVMQYIAAAGQDAKDYRAATATYQGTPFAACWRPLFEQKVIILVYDDGDQGLVPFADLKPVKEA